MSYARLVLTRVHWCQVQAGVCSDARRAVGHRSAGAYAYSLRGRYQMSGIDVAYHPTSPVLVSDKSVSGTEVLCGLYQAFLRVVKLEPESFECW